MKLGDKSSKREDLSILRRNAKEHKSETIAGMEQKKKMKKIEREATEEQRLDGEPEWQKIAIVRRKNTTHIKLVHI